MIAQTTAALSQLVAAEAEHERTHHSAYLVGASVFVVLVLLLLATLSFNRER